MNKKFLFILSILLISLSFSSCNKSKDEVIVFDNSQPLSLAPDVTWAVVTEPYASFKNTASWEAQASGYCRKGEILQVMGHALDEKKENWYYFEKGWLPKSSLNIYSNWYKASKAASTLVESQAEK